MPTSMSDVRPEPHRATFLLVHGAFHGGWCYSRVADILRAAGHRVFTPTLTGLGERSHLYSPAINASTHIRDVLNVMAFEELDDVVLAGHSYGGQVITGVADAVPERIRALVYLDAFVGRDGKSTLDMDAPAAVAAHTESARFNGGHTIPPLPAAVFGVNAADRAWVDRLCTPQPFATFAERLSLTGRHEEIARRAYVFAKGWTTPFGPTFETVRARGRWMTYEFDGGHDVMIDQPRETADVLLAAAAG